MSKATTTVTHPETIVGARMSEVDYELKWLVVERLQCQKNVVDQEIAVHIQNPNTTHNQITLNTLNKYVKSCTHHSHHKHIIYIYIYTVNHKKTCHFVFDYNSGVSCSIFTIFVPVERGRNALQYTYLMTWWHHNSVTIHITKNYFIQLVKILLHTVSSKN